MASTQATKHTTALKKIKRAVASKALDRLGAMRTIHRLGNKRFAKASIKGRITCEKLNVVLANEGRKLKKVEGRVVEGKRRVFVFDAGEELEQKKAAKEDLGANGGFWSAYFDTFFREQESPVVV